MSAQVPAGPPSAHPSLLRASAVMSVGTALSRLSGFARLAVTAWAIGATESKLADTYNLANSMPNIVYNLVLGEVLATVFVPVFVEHMKRRSEEESWELASSMLNLSLVVSAAFAAITIAIAPWLMKIYTFHTDPAVRAQEQVVGTFFLRIFLPQIIFYALGSVATGLLNAHRRFAAPMFAPILNNVVVIATFVAFHHVHRGRITQLHGLTRGDELLLAVGTTLGVVAMTVVLWPSLRALPGRWSLRTLDWRNPAIRRVGTLAKFTLGYVAVNQLGLWVVLALANARTGGVTVFQQSYILYQLPYGIFAVSIMTALVPTLSEHFVDGNREAARRDVSLGLRTTTFVVAPAAAGFIALSYPIIRLLLQHGTFTARSTSLNASTFALMTTGLVAFAAFQQLTRAFYTMQDARTPFYVNIAVNAVQIGTAFPLFFAAGVPGLALSHSLSYWTGALVAGALLRASLGGLDGRAMASSTARIAAASAATGGVAWVVARALAPGAHASLGAQLEQVIPAVAAGMLTYAALARLLRMSEFKPMLRMIGR
jgi:putative peptidoglycan lipid II flippase